VKEGWQGEGKKKIKKEIKRTRKLKLNFSQHIYRVAIYIKLCNTCFVPNPLHSFKCIL